MDIWRGMTDSTGSSRSHQGSHRNRIRCAFSDHESSLRASHLLWTKHGEQCRKEYEKNPVARRKNGARSAVGCVQYRSQHRGGNRPINLLDSIGKFPGEDSAFTLIAAWRARAISLSCSNLGLLPRISGNQNCPTAPFMCPIFPCAGAGAFTHCDGSRPTPHTMYA